MGLVKGNTLYWVTADHLGRPEVVTNASQQIVWRAANQAFDRSVLVDKIGGYRLGFPGQSLDAESGLWHNGFRDYEASLGRYVQSDPIGLAGGVSTYGYAKGSPVILTDLLGLDVMVCLYDGAMGLGHVGAGFNPSVTAGYHPRPNASGNAFSGTPGYLRVDDASKRQECITIKTSAEQDQKMVQHMRAVEQDPGEYQLTGNNCVNYVRTLLSAGGLQSPLGIQPRPFFSGLKELYGQ